MATSTADRAKATFPVSGHGFGGNMKVAWGTFDVGANPSDDDIIEMCRVPKGATVIGGWIQGEDLDTGTEELDFDAGWAANGDEVADPDGFGDFGVVTGDASVHTPVAGIHLHLAGVLVTEGPKTFNAETMLQIEFNAAAAAGGTGRLSMYVIYLMP